MSSPASSDSEDTLTSDSSFSERSSGTSTHREPHSSPNSGTVTPKGKKRRVRRSRNWQKNIRKHNRNAGKRYKSDSTKQEVGIL